MGGLGTPAMETEGEEPIREEWQADGEPISAAGKTGGGRQQRQTVHS